ncbi:MAG: hypothetical protein Q8S21_05095 [Candidatus Paracaedibacteraceae bacterium]|nr:hypothetical protein [Candidatus Paracaedibacteraceae bacterium]
MFKTLFNINQTKFLGSNHILVIPHHRSESNISKEMIDLFNPNLAIISAANGMQYSNPYRKVYEWLMEEITDPIFEEYGTSENLILCFGGYKNKNYYSNKIKTEKSSEYAALKTGNLGKKSKIISTNFSGTIKFKNEKVLKTFSPTVEHEDKNYKVNLNNSIKN